jgi:putative ABC transport system permease protein
MLRSYLTVALRNLWRHRSYSINGLLSLAVSLSVCLLLVLLLYDQWRFDRHHAHADRLHRVVSTSGGGDLFASSPAPLGPALQARTLGVEAMSRVAPASGEAIVEGAGLAFDGYYVEPAFFELFDWPIRAGAAPEVLAAPKQAFVSAAWAARVFGTANPVGEPLELDGIGTVTVAGVLDVPPGPTHLRGDVFLSFATQEAQHPERAASWRDSFWNTYNYVRLAPNVRPEQLQASFETLRAEHFPEADPGAYTFRLQSITDIALGPQMRNDPAQDQGVLPGIAGYFLVGLGLIVLLAAVFTFTNLSLARVLQRTREVGVRKTMGASRGHVVGQFLTEALVLALLALGLAVAALPGLVALFNRLFLTETIGLQLGLDLLRDPRVLLAFLGVALGVGVMAGGYPAWVLSAPQPVEVLRGQLGGPAGALFGRVRLRRTLLAAQVGLSFVLVVTVLLMYRQSAYELRAGYGFDTDRLLHVPVQEAPLEVLEETARALPGVESVAAVAPLPVAGAQLYHAVRVDGDERTWRVFGGDRAALLATLSVDLVAGTLPRAANEVVINETAARAMGAAQPQAALGRTLQRGTTPRTVRGVVQDFHVDSFLERIEPVVFLAAEDQGPGHLLIRADRSRHAAILEQIEAVWPRLDPVHAFEGSTLREALRSFRGPYRDTMGLLGATAGFALFITALGLLGVAAYVTQARRREVGIRKALGASVASLATLLSKEFLALIGVALLVAGPLGWVLNDWWLGFYAYRIALGPSAFLAAAVLVLAATLGTAGLQAWRTARLDPASVLRQE